MELPEIRGDLFTADESFALAHCVSREFKMGKGIARSFKERFERVDRLLEQNVDVGGVAALNVYGRQVYYLVTKDRFYERPMYEHLEASLVALRDRMRADGVGKLAIPRLGCGLDRLDWERVREMVRQVFAETGIEVRVYFLR